MVRNKVGKFLPLSMVIMGKCQGKISRGRGGWDGECPAPVMASSDAELTETNRRHSPDTPRQTITTTVFLGVPSV